MKTRQDAGTEWILTSKAQEVPESDVADNLYYVFVSLNGAEAPSFHVAPRVKVADYVRTNHQTWLDTPGQRGRAHRDTTVRKFSDANGEFSDAWHLLGLDL